MIRSLARRGIESGEIELGYGELAPGEVVQLDGGDEAVVVVMRGEVGARVDGEELGVAGGRDDVFSELGEAVYAPPGARLRLEGAQAGATVAIMRAAPGEDAPGPPRIIVSAPGEDAPGPPRIIRAGDQHVATVGDGNWQRTVRTMLGPDDRASRLLVGETLNPPGNWSSYPPHKHDRHDPPDEARLEEIYLFRVDPPSGFGVQLLYEPGSERTFMVRDGDVAVIRSGYHPVVAAPGYQLYYLWVLAGGGRTMAPRLDPDHAWVAR